ncbi:unnamed protein product, partial [Mesorhabditis belari]|uniref:Protein kinase domain-containing protein n=1 Tax=Mesorhabditis belari TaxID=2138241 RepID=A0AAF3EC57_9BILA
MEQTFRPSRKRYVHWEIKENIGFGGFGQCWKVEYRMPFGKLSVGVLKLLRVEQMTEENRAAFIKEEKYMRLYQDANLIKYISGCVDERDTTRRGILMEFCEKGSLKKIIHDAEIFYPAYTFICWVVDLFDALDYFKRQGVIHMDLKPDNILVTNEYLLKIADFGAMKVASRQGVPLSRYSPPTTGTSHYQAPERYKGVEQLSPKYDVFTMGLVLWELIERNCTNVKQQDRWGALRAKLELEEVKKRFEQELVPPNYIVEEVKGRTTLKKPFPSTRVVQDIEISDAGHVLALSGQIRLETFPEIVF